jgi:hypothetical protein
LRGLRALSFSASSIPLDDSSGCGISIRVRHLDRYP